MDTLSWFNSILNLLAILSVISGLWIAGRLLPTFIKWLHSKDNDEGLTRPSVKILLWLALGALLTLPLLDFVSWLGNLVNVVLVPQTGGGFSTMLGTVSPRVYSLFPLFLTLAVYGITLYLGSDYISTPGQFNQIERILIILSIASLVYKGIHAIFTFIFSFQIPIINVQQNYGISGYLFEILVGIAILTLIMVGLNRILSNHPVSGK